MDDYITPPTRSNVNRKRRYSSIIPYSSHKKLKLTQYFECNIDNRNDEQLSEVVIVYEYE